MDFTSFLAFSYLTQKPHWPTIYSTQNLLKAISFLQISESPSFLLSNSLFAWVFSHLPFSLNSSNAVAPSPQHLKLVSMFSSVLLIVFRFLCWCQLVWKFSWVRPEWISWESFSGRVDLGFWGSGFTLILLLWVSFRVVFVRGKVVLSWLVFVNRLILMFVHSVNF